MSSVREVSCSPRRDIWTNEACLWAEIAQGPDWSGQTTGWWWWEECFRAALKTTHYNYPNYQQFHRGASPGLAFRSLICPGTAARRELPLTRSLLLQTWGGHHLLVSLKLHLKKWQELIQRKHLLKLKNGTLFWLRCSSNQHRLQAKVGNN